MSAPQDARGDRENFADQMMARMRLKNEQYMQRYAEVQQDKLAAESQNSAVTLGSKLSKKEKEVQEKEIQEKEVQPKQYAREWDRDKPDLDHWDSPEHYAPFRSYRPSHYDKRMNKTDEKYKRNPSRNDRKVTTGRESDGNFKKDAYYSHKKNSFSPRKFHDSEYRNKSYDKYAKKSSERFEPSSTSNLIDNRRKTVNVPKKEYLSHDRYDYGQVEEENRGVRIDDWLTTVHKSTTWTQEVLSSEHGPPTEHKLQAQSTKFSRYKDGSDKSTDCEDNLNVTAVDKDSQKSKPLDGTCVNKKFSEEESQNKGQSANTSAEHNLRKYEKNSSNLEYSQNDSRINRKYRNKDVSNPSIHDSDDDIQVIAVIENSQKNKHPEEPQNRKQNSNNYTILCNAQQHMKKYEKNSSGLEYSKSDSRMNQRKKYDNKELSGESKEKSLKLKIQEVPKAYNRSNKDLDKSKCDNSPQKKSWADYEESRDKREKMQIVENPKHSNNIIKPVLTDKKEQNPQFVDDDGIWDATEQSDIVWALDEKEFHSETLETKDSLQIHCGATGPANRTVTIKKKDNITKPYESKVPKTDENEASDNGSWATISEEDELDVEHAISDDDTAFKDSSRQDDKRIRRE